jgi:hypothetical protein
MNQLLAHHIANFFRDSRWVHTAVQFFLAKHRPGKFLFDLKTELTESYRFGATHPRWEPYA